MPTTEETIYSPDTVALVLDRLSINSNFLQNHPSVILSKPLAGEFVIAYVNQHEVDSIISDVQRYTSSIHPIVLGLLQGAEALDASTITQVQRHPVLNLLGNGVLLGFVDTGIDYTKPAFIYEDGTSKIQYIWDQSFQSGNSPAGYLYGTEYNNEQINQALRSENPLEIVPQIDTVGHGTFLASVAGGRADEGHIGAAPDAEIIMVKLKKARPFTLARYLVPQWQENAFASDDYMMGVQYILDKAAALKKPVAICVSVGSNFGPHDGTNTFARFLTRVGGIIGTSVCAAAGDESQAGHHTSGRFSATGETRDIQFRASDKHEDMYIQIWNNAVDRLSASVTSPSGEVISRVQARSGISYRNKLLLERSTVTIEYLFPIEINGAQLTRIKILSATPGIWTITLYGDTILDGEYHSWLPMRGFIDPGTRFLTPMPNYTITTPANASGIITCGAYNDADNILYTFSSWGPTRLQSISPDLVAPGADVEGLYPTGYGTMSGTSVSAAITTGACALILQWGIVQGNEPAIDTNRIRASLIAGCDRDPNIDYPNNQWGYGRLNLFNTFRALRPL